MSGGFTKLFSTITESTVWCEPDATRLVWITMLAMVDQHGYVGASVPGLAHRARVSIDDCHKALQTFLGPDPYSRTADNEGRRIAEADGGWLMLNYQKYREFGNPVKRGLDEQGYVYYIGVEGGDKIKIGFSKNPWARLYDLKTAEPGLEILATERGAMAAEKERHKEFSADRLSGEWFAASPSLRSLIVALGDRDDRPKRPAPKSSRPTVVKKTATVGIEAEAEAEADTSKATAKERAAPSAKRGCRLPPDWAPNDDGVALAESLGVSWRAELEKFRDYWTAQAGAKAVKLDWDATWRNWVRNAKPTLRSASTQQQTGKTMQALVALEGMKSGNRLADRRDFDGDAETALLGLGTPAGRGGFAGNGSGVD